MKNLKGWNIKIKEMQLKIIEGNEIQKTLRINWKKC